MGHVYSRFFSHLPADTPVQPQKIQPNSFVKRNLPLTPTRRGIYAHYSRKSVKNEDFTKSGGGGGGAVIGRSSNSGILRRPARALLERPNRRVLVVVDVEHGEQAGDLQQVAHVLVQVHQLEFAALVPQGGVVANQLADAGAVDVIDAGEVDENLVVSLAHELLHHVAEFAGTLAEAKLSGEVHNRNAFYDAGAGLNCHVLAPSSISTVATAA